VNPQDLNIKEKLLKEPLFFFEVNLATTSPPQPITVLPALYPYSFKDISFVLKEQYTFQHVQQVIQALAPQMHLKDMVFKNLYTLTPQRQRMTIGLCFNNPDNQLTEARVRGYVDTVMLHLDELILSA
jgi:phenylalanyl-tRNA synthetase beta subunit